MTLILSMAAPGLAAQVSDRQVTLRQPGRPDSIYSPVENKTIIFLARDAVGVLGYTGSAYVRDQTTDEWLARQIAPSAFTGPEGMAFHMGGRRRDRLNDIIWRIRSSLAGGELGCGGRLGLCMVGFRVRRHRWVSFLAEFGWPHDFLADDFAMRRPISREGAWRLSQIGDPFTFEETRRLILAEVDGAEVLSDDTFVSGMARVIRDRAAVSDLVGPNLMAVRISQPRQRRVEWEFLPAEPHFATVVTPTAQRDFHATYSPWIISPGSLVRPTFGTGHFTIHTCGWTIAPVRRLGPPPLQYKIPAHSSGNVLFAVDTQERPPPPR